MMPTTEITPTTMHTDSIKPKLFYGWRIVAAGAAMLFVTSVVYAQGFSLFTYVMDDIYPFAGFSIPSREGHPSLRLLDYVLRFFPVSAWVGIVVSPVAGSMVDRFGPRRIVPFGAILGGIGYVFINLAHTTWDYHAAVLTASIGFNLCASIVFVSTIGKWFVRHRARAFAVLMTVSALSFIGVPLLGLAIDTFGLRTSMFATGILTAVMSLPVALLMRHRPEDHGIAPDGDKQLASKRREISASPGQVLRLRPFWQLTIAFGIVGFVDSSQLATGNMLDVVNSSYTVVTAPFSVGVLLGIVGVITIGVIGDRVNKRNLLTKLVTVKMVSIGIIVLLSGDFTEFPLHWIAIVPAYLCAQVATGALLPLSYALLADYFGRASLGAVIGISASVIGIVGLVLALVSFPLGLLLGLARGPFGWELILTMIGILVAVHLGKNLESQSRVAARIRLLNRS